MSNAKNTATKKHGRHKLSVNEVKTDRLEIRLTQNTVKKLTTYCKKNDISMSQTVRVGLAKLFAEDDIE
ncbi:hypothetical protein EG832_02990 [bacterium]|nr:hypothetical protein [bacterium]